MDHLLQGSLPVFCWTAEYANGHITSSTQQEPSEHTFQIVANGITTHVYNHSASRWHGIGGCETPDLFLRRITAGKKHKAGGQLSGERRGVDLHFPLSEPQHSRPLLDLREIRSSHLRGGQEQSISLSSLSLCFLLALSIRPAPCRVPRLCACLFCTLLLLPSSPITQFLDRRSLVSERKPPIASQPGFDKSWTLRVQAAISGAQ